jgi:hypothetical protein
LIKPYNGKLARYCVRSFFGSQAIDFSRGEDAAARRMRRIIVRSPSITIASQERLPLAQA